MAATPKKSILTDAQALLLAELELLKPELAALWQKALAAGLEWRVFLHSALEMKWEEFKAWVESYAAAKPAA